MCLVRSLIGAPGASQSPFRGHSMELRQSIRFTMTRCTVWASDPCEVENISKRAQARLLVLHWQGGWARACHCLPRAAWCVRRTRQAKDSQEEKGGRERTGCKEK